MIETWLLQLKQQQKQDRQTIANHESKPAKLVQQPVRRADKRVRPGSAQNVHRVSASKGRRAQRSRILSQKVRR